MYWYYYVLVLLFWIFGQQALLLSIFKAYLEGHMDGDDLHLVTRASENSAELQRSVVQRQYLGRSFIII